MIGSAVFEPPDKIKIVGYPEGVRVYRLALQSAEELRRLFLFGRDLDQSLAWLSRMKELDRSDVAREALAVAALIRFLGCFESTGGHRKKPLKRSKVFPPPERPYVEELRQLRNKIFVHDEQLHPTHDAWVAIGQDGKAIEAGVIALGFWFANMDQFKMFSSLVLKAREWVQTQFDAEVAAIVSQINEIDPEEVLEQANAAGPLNVRINLDEPLEPTPGREN